MSNNAPAIPLFGDAYLADTRHLTLEEHGAYLQLMMIAWRIEGCCLPDDDKRLARMLGISLGKWEKLKPTVMDFWTLENGVWKQGRLSKERKFVEEKRAKNKSSAEARWNAQPIENKQNEECERIRERNAPPPPPPPNVKNGVTNVTPMARARVAKVIIDWPCPFGVAEPHWRDFLGNRKAKRLPNTQTALDGQLADLDRVSLETGKPPGEVVRICAAKGWGAIYNWTEGKGGNNGKQSDADGFGRTGRAVMAVRERIRAAGIQ